MSSVVASALRRPTLRSNGSGSGKSSTTSASSSKSTLSAYSYRSSTSTDNDVPRPAAHPPVIHADALPFLKRQQLENLCTRVGLKSSGKKADLVARLETYALGQGSSASTLQGKASSSSSSSSTAATMMAKRESAVKGPRQFPRVDDNDKENHANVSLLSNDSGHNGIPHEPVSIRVIKSVRESLDGGARASIGKDTGAGIVMPSSGTLPSLQSQGGYEDVSKVRKGTSGKGRQPLVEQSRVAISVSSGSDKTLKAAVDCHSVDGANGAQRPARRPSSGLGPKMRSVSRGLTRILSSHSIGSTAAQAQQAQQEMVASTPSNASPQREKRKRNIDEDGVGPTSDGLSYATDDKMDEMEQPVRHVLSPQRVIKPRPTRAIARPSGQVAQSDKVEAKPDVKSVVTVPTRAFTFTMPRSPQPKVAATAPTSDEQASHASEEATDKVLAEMQARLVRNGKPAQASTENLRLRVLQEQSVGGRKSPQLPPSPLKSVDSRTRDRFTSQHDKHFGQMDSIANHYAARRAATQRKPEANETKDDSMASGAASSSTEDDERATSKRQRTEDGREIKTAVTFSPPPTELATRSDEERAAMRRKLELSRERRRSGSTKSPLTTVSAARRKSQSSTSASKKGGAAVNTSYTAGTFAHKIGHAVRGFVNSASTMRNSSSSKPLPALPAVPKSSETVASSVTASNTASRTAVLPSRIPTAGVKPATKPVFDLQASLARKPKGYTPYSAKQTAELFSAEAQKTQQSQPQVVASRSGSSNASSAKISNGSDNNATPIRQGWLWVPTPEKPADTGSVPFPQEVVASPLPIVRATPSKRAGAAKSAIAARKSRSSVSQTARATVRGGTVGSMVSGIAERKPSGTPAKGLAKRRLPSGPARTMSGSARPRAIAMRSGSNSSSASSSSMSTARAHQRRPSGVPRFNSSQTSRKRRSSLLPPRIPVISQPRVNLGSPTRRTVQTIVPSPRPGLRSPVRRVSGRGRGKPSVRPVEDGADGTQSGISSSGHGKSITPQSAA